MTKPLRKNNMTRDRFTSSEWIICQTIKKVNVAVAELHRRIGRMVAHETIDWTAVEELKVEIARLNHVASELDLM